MHPFKQHRAGVPRKLFTMELSSVFSKTAKGLNEISTRAHRLPARVRALLIMVDGRRTGSQLLALGASAAEGKRHLGALLDGGFIQPQKQAATAAAAAAAVRTVLPNEDISLAKSYVIRTLHELVGADARALVAEIEKADTPDELRQHFGKLRTALSTAADQKLAKQFLEKVALVLD